MLFACAWWSSRDVLDAITLIRGPSQQFSTISAALCTKEVRFACVKRHNTSHIHVLCFLGTMLNLFNGVFGKIQGEITADNIEFYASQLSFQKNAEAQTRP